MASTEDEWRWWVGHFAFGTGTIIGIIIVSMHSKNVYLDMVHTRKNMQKRTEYTLLSLIILCSLFSYVITMMISILFWIPQFIPFCHVFAIIATWSYGLSKTFMYLAIIIRLHLVYSNPIYHYNLTLLKIVSVLVVIFGFLLAIFSNFTTKTDAFHGTKSYIKGCKLITNPFVNILTAAKDMILCIGSIIAFLYPLRKIIKSILNNTNISNEQRNKLNELIQTGNKYVILTMIATLSTFMLMVIVKMGYALFAGIDFITNMICLMLMTPYYNDKVYYERICCGAIRLSNWCLVCCYGYNRDLMEMDNVINSRDEKKCTIDLQPAKSQTSTTKTGSGSSTK